MPEQGKKKRVPPEDWSIERPFDSSDYLDRPVPTYEDEDQLGDGNDPPGDDE